MSISDQLDKASAQLKRLSEKASAAEAEVNALRAKNKAELKQQVDVALAAAKQASDDLKVSAKESKDEITQWWGQVQDNWKAHMAKVRKHADQSKANLKADLMEVRAQRAEAYAAAAVDFAYAALEEAQYQVLNAAMARTDAEEAQAAT